jgi:uncharacterized protein
MDHDRLIVWSDDSGTLFRVRVSPRASRTQIEGTKDGVLQVRLNAPPVDGAANKALRELIARTLRCPRGSVEIIRGERSRDKTVLLRQSESESVRRILERT